MGLDLVEYVLAIEEAFEIRFPDAFADTLETVWDLCVWILKNRLT